MRRLAACAATLLFSGCVGPDPAALATYNAVAPEYRAYVEADASLTAEQKQSRFDTITTWRIRVGGAK